MLGGPFGHLGDIMFDFDLSALDDISFKEDSVREEVILPILKRLGFKATGANRIERSKSLVHPYVMIGSKKYAVSIIPDYTLYVDNEPVLILEAKAPTEKINNSIHTEQAYSYAIHPEIKIKQFSLCNGRNLIMYSTNEWKPILDIEISNIDREWDKVEKAMGPKYLKIPELRDFHPDYGLTYLKASLNTDIDQLFYQHYLQGIMMYELGKYTGFTTTMLGDLDCLVSLDMEESHVIQLLNCLPERIQVEAKTVLKMAPYQIDVAGKITFSCRGKIGKIINGPFEDFAPIVIKDVFDIKYDPLIELK